MKVGKVFALSFGLVATTALAAPIKIEINLVDAAGVGKSIGTVGAEDSKDGLVLTPKLTGLAPGDHGFHVHEAGSCGPKEKDGKPVAALAAGGHYDPQTSGKHEGPSGKGHLGDLPPLKVDQKGEANGRLVAPRLKVADLKGRSLMIHEGGDNYSDDPKPLGGGGARVACGIVK
jgi:Cu-Zn family superoxide dismutase